MNTSFFQKFVEQIPPITKKYVGRQGEFAVKLSELLESTGMTQRELAKKLGKKESYVSRMLAGCSNPTLKTIVEFEVALGKDIVDFNLQVKKVQSEKQTCAEFFWKSKVRKYETPRNNYIYNSYQDDGDVSGRAA